MLSLAALLAVGGTASATTLSCASDGGRRQFCSADTRGGVMLVRQQSRAACIDGETWGYDRDGIWVDHGCRGQFALASHRSSRRARGVTCESIGDDRRRCAIDTSQGVRLSRQLSRTRCVQGENWDFDRDSVWVDGGCRAEFTTGAGFSDGHENDDGGIDGNAMLLGLGALAVAAVAAGAMGGAGNALAEPATPSPAASSWVDPGSYYASTTVPPSWVVGTFEGYNPLYDTGMLISVDDHGGAVAYVDDLMLTGQYQQGQLRLGGVDYGIEALGGDIVATQLNTPGNRSVYARLR
jgi:hypothetical protein